MGTFAPYEVPGINTGPNGRYPHGAAPNAFAPQYLCLVYVKFDGAGIAARHAYFPVPANLQAFATAEFSSVTSSGVWATAPIRSEVNFENFAFGSQQLIVFHVDPAGTPARFDPNNLVQFAEWSAGGPKTPPTRKTRNNCFLNPVIQAWPGMDVMILENWYVDDNGQPITAPLQLFYTMNVHLLMRCVLSGSGDGMRELPFVLDPDTGNMGGTP